MFLEQAHEEEIGDLEGGYCAPPLRCWGDEWERMREGYEFLGEQYSLRNPGVWTYLWHLASCGLDRGVLGGPPCRTVSRMRHMKPGPRPLRGRGPERLGKADLTISEQEAVDGDTALLLKQLELWWKAWKCREGGDGEALFFFMESPRDPFDYLEPELCTKEEFPSYWEFPVIRDLLEVKGMQKITFDQGPLGHARQKPTSVRTNAREMRILHGVSGPGYEPLEEDLQRRMTQSKRWAEWAPTLVETLKMALKGFIARDLGTVKGAVKDDGGTVEGACRARPHSVSQRVSYMYEGDGDRPPSSPAATSSFHVLLELGCDRSLRVRQGRGYAAEGAICHGGDSPAAPCVWWWEIDASAARGWACGIGP